MAAVFFEWHTRRGKSHSLKWSLKKARATMPFDFSSTGVCTLAYRFKYDCYVTVKLGAG